MRAAGSSSLEVFEDTFRSEVTAKGFAPFRMRQEAAARAHGVEYRWDNKSRRCAAAVTGRALSHLIEAACDNMKDIPLCADKKRCRLATLCRDLFRRAHARRLLARSASLNDRTGVLVEVANPSPLKRLW